MNARVAQLAFTGRAAAVVLTLAASAALGLALCAPLACPPPAAARADTPRALSAQERAALQSGQLVTRPEQRLRGDDPLIGGLAWQRVAAPPERIWRALGDVATYPHFLPAVSEARRMQRVGDEERVFIRHHLGLLDASYCVMIALDVSRGRMRFRLDHGSPSSIRDAWGEIDVTASDAGSSVISLAIMADVGTGLLEGLVRPEVHEWMLRIPQQLQRYVERQRH